MFVIDRAQWQKEDPIWEKVIPLMKEIFGYTDEEAQGFRDVIDIGYAPPLAINVTEEQIIPIVQPFIDHKIDVHGCEYDDTTYKLVSMFPVFLNFDEDKRFIFDRTRIPQTHYYDEPIILEHQKVDPFNPPEFGKFWRNGIFAAHLTTDKIPTEPPKPSKPIVTCPYCKSTDCKKISGLSKVGSVALWGIFALGKTTKQWHCNSCKADF